MASSILPPALLEQLESRSVEDQRAGLAALLAAPEASVWIEQLMQSLPARLRYLQDALLLYAPEGCLVERRAKTTGIRLEAFCSGPLAEAPFERLPALERLQINREELIDPSVLSSLVNLKSLILWGCVPDGFPLPTMPRLEALWIRSDSRLQRVDALADQPCVERLQIEGSGLVSLESLRAELPALTSLGLTRSPELTRLDGLSRHTGLTTLNLSDNHALQSLEGIPGGPGLQSLSLDRCKALQSFAGLPALPSVTRFNLHITPDMTLAGIERLTGLDTLKIWSHSPSVDLAPLASLPALVVLDLTHLTSLTDITALEASTSLKVILLCGSGVTRKSVPKSMRWRCSWARLAKVYELRKKSPPKPSKPRKVTSRSALARITKMLKTNDPATIDQAFELMRAHVEPSWIDSLLAGTVHERDPNIYHSIWRGRASDTYAYRLRNRRFTGRAAADVVCGLLAVAPPQSTVAAKVQAEVEALALCAPKHLRGQTSLFNLSSLGGLKSLKRLAILPLWAGWQLRASGPKPTLPALEALYFHQACALSMDWLAGSPRLQDVTIVGSTAPTLGQDLAGLSRGVTQLQLSRCTGIVDLSGLAGMNALEHLSLFGCTALVGLGTLSALPALTKLEIRDCPQLHSLAGLSAPKLQELSCPDQDVSSLTAVGDPSAPSA